MTADVIDAWAPKVVYATLLGLAVAAATTGNLSLAIALGGVKALLVGTEFMELKHAARPHGVAYAVVISVLVLALVLLTR